MTDKFDRNGKPIGLMEWAKAMEKDRHVGLDTIDGIRVSTVWLGLNHRFDNSGPPLIFETMVFGGDDDGWMQRYSTEDEARAGHAAVVAKVRAGDRL